jgi:hypothetical protein
MDNAMPNLTTDLESEWHMMDDDMDASYGKIPHNSIL